jgi:phage shock protein PspC (stress-responsive transcriptional regulator)
MNKVITIHLHGTAFQLEEGGYDALRAYLDQAARQLEPNPDRAEILADIEQAIGEKFRALLNASRNVVLTAEVEAVIAEMGPVDDGSGAAADEKRGTAPASGPQPAAARADAGPSGPPKRLYRIDEGAMISGICTGLAAYLGIDVVLIRLVAIVLGCLSLGTAAIVYFVARFIIPVARTPEEMAAATGPSQTAHDFVRMAREGYYEGMKTFSDRHARREWRRKFRRDMRDWKRNFRWDMRYRFGGLPPTPSTPFSPCPPPPEGFPVFLPVLSTLKTLLFFLCMFAILSLIATGSVLGMHLPGGLPVWAGVVLLFLAYKVVVSPIKALRRACYYRNLGWPYYWHPAAELVQGLVTLCFLALFVFLADRFIPGFHQALLAVPGMLQHAAEVVRHWWTQR